MTNETSQVTKHSAEAPKTDRAFVRLALDLGPLIVFFAVNVWSDIFAATASFMVAFFAALGVAYWLERRLSPMPLVTGAVVLVFGGLTLYLNDEVFIKLKPTIVYAVFAIVLLGGLLNGRPLIRILFQSAFELPETAWRILTWRWALLFVAFAILNELVRHNVSTDIWVAFKVWGFLPLTIAFTLAQVPFIQRHQIGDRDPATLDQSADGHPPTEQKFSARKS